MKTKGVEREREGGGRERGREREGERERARERDFYIGRKSIILFPAFDGSSFWWDH